MNLYYHGTNLDGALGIARYGAILSRWDQEILGLQTAIAAGQILKLAKDETLEDVALRLASVGFSAEEIEQKVKSVAISTERIALMNARVHERKHSGGVVLGFELPMNESSEIVFVPRSVSIDGLKEIQVFTTLARVENKEFDKLRTAFKKYSPSYVYVGYAGF